MIVEIDNRQKTVKIENLNPGDTFVMNGQYYMMTDEMTASRESAKCVRIINGCLLGLSLQSSVVPVRLKAVPDEG